MNKAVKNKIAVNKLNFCIARSWISRKKWHKILPQNSQLVVVLITISTVSGIVVVAQILRALHAIPALTKHIGPSLNRVIINSQFLPANSGIVHGHQFNVPAVATAAAGILKKGVMSHVTKSPKN